MVTFLPTPLSTSEDKIFMFCNFNMKSYLSFAKVRQKVCLRGQTWRLLSSKGASLSSDWPETTARYENVLVTHLSASSSLSRYSGDVRRLKNTKELFFFSNFFYIVNPMLYVGKKSDCDMLMLQCIKAGKTEQCIWYEAKISLYLESMLPSEEYLFWVISCNKRMKFI